MIGVNRIKQGTCICVHEPRGLNKLEGYQRGEEYKYVLLEDKKGIHYGVYPSVLEPEYYETCVPAVFNRFFKIKDKDQ